MVSHDVIETRQEAQTGTNLDVHRTVHIVEEVERLVDQLTALLQKTWNKEHLPVHAKPSHMTGFSHTHAGKSKRLTLLHFSLSALEEVEGVRSFGVDVLHDRENIQDVLLCEGWLVAAVKVVLFNQDLEGRRTGAVRAVRQKRRGH